MQTNFHWFTWNPRFDQRRESFQVRTEERMGILSSDRTGSNRESKLSFKPEYQMVRVELARGTWSYFFFFTSKNRWRRPNIEHLCILGLPHRVWSISKERGMVLYPHNQWQSEWEVNKTVIFMSKNDKFLLESDLQRFLIMMLRNPELIFLPVVFFFCCNVPPFNH